MGINLSVIPKTEDGKMYFSPDIFPGGLLTYYCGQGDDIANGTFSGGTKCRATTSAAETMSPIEVQYISYTYITAGILMWDNAAFGDEVTFEVVAPATPNTPNVGAGGYDIVGGVYVPNGTTTGSCDLNLTEKLNANVPFTKAVPLPSYTGTGFFYYDCDTHVLTVRPGQDGNCHLLSVEKVVATFANCVSIIGSGTSVLPLVPPPVKPSKTPPHYIQRTTITNSSAKTLEVSWLVYMGRESTA